MTAFSGTAQDFDFAVAKMVTPVAQLLLKDRLLAIVQPLTGLQPTSVTWDKDPQPMTSDLMRALVTLSVKSGRFLGGSDDKRRTLDGSFYTTEICGQRTVMLTLKCEAYDRSYEASWILERVRTLLHANFELTPLGLSVISRKLISDLPTKYDNRVVNCAVLEIELGAVSNFAAQQLIGQGWIDTVNTNDVVPGDYT